MDVEFNKINNQNKFNQLRNSWILSGILMPKIRKG